MLVTAEVSQPPMGGIELYWIESICAVEHLTCFPYDSLIVTASICIPYGPNRPIADILMVLVEASICDRRSHMPIPDILEPMAEVSQLPMVVGCGIRPRHQLTTTEHANHVGCNGGGIPIADGLVERLGKSVIEHFHIMVTEDVSQLLISSSNSALSLKACLILVTAEVFQSLMCP